MSEEGEHQEKEEVKRPHDGEVGILPQKIFGLAPHYRRKTIKLAQLHGLRMIPSFISYSITFGAGRGETFKKRAEFR